MISGECSLRKKKRFLSYILLSNDITARKEPPLDNKLFVFPVRMTYLGQQLTSTPRRLVNSFPTMTNIPHNIA